VIEENYINSCLRRPVIEFENICEFDLTTMENMRLESEGETR